MKPQIVTLALALLATGCSGGSGGGASSGPPVATPTPSPAPTVSPTPSPTASPTPLPSPTASSTSYFTIPEIYTNRFGSAGVTLASACSGFTFGAEPPAVAAVTPFGQGPSFRFIVTPNVWSVTGVGGFDGRDSDPFRAMFPDPIPANVEVGYSRQAAQPVRFSLTRPVAEGSDLFYARLGLVWIPSGGARIQQHCVVGVPTVPEDLPAAPSGNFRAATVIATAYVREGGATRAYLLTRSTATVAVDIAAARVTLSMRLLGTATDAAGGEIDLGTVTATAPIDTATGNFGGPLAGARPLAGAVTGRLLGPRGVEVGIAFDAAAPATTTLPGYSLAGAVFAVR